MATRLSGGGSFDLGQTSKINVTPLVGVLLLVLIIFMIAAPAPPASSVQIDNSIGDWFGPPPKKQQVFINVEQNHKLYIGAHPTSLDTLVADVGSAIGGPHPTDQYIIRIRANRFVPYGDFMTVMSALKEGGYEVGLITEDL